MSENKGPIERIRNAVNYMASRMPTPQIESVADDVREACNELEQSQAARDEVEQAKQPHVDRDALPKGGPIERIREQLKAVWNTSGLGSAALAIQDAVEELEKAKQSEQLTALSAVITDAERGVIFAALSHLGVTGWYGQRKVGQMLAKICGEWRDLHGTPGRQPLMATVSEADWDCIFRACESLGMLAADDAAQIGERLTAICADWMDRKQAEVAAAQRDQDSYFDLDSNDMADIERAITMRKTLNALPASDSCERGALLAEICRGWMDRVENDRKQKEQQQAGDVVQIHWTLSRDDYAAIREALAYEETLAINPNGNSCADAAVIAAVVRDWLGRPWEQPDNNEPIDNGNGTTTARIPVTMPTEWFSNGRDLKSMTLEDAKQPGPIDNGDGTVTTWAPVTVPKDWLEAGRKVVRVGCAKQGDVFFSPASEGFVRAGVDHCRDEVRVILSAPQFREGGYYRDTADQVRGPLRRVDWTADQWGWFDQDDRQYTPEGKAKSRVADLRPGEVPVWEKPPASLKAGEYLWEVSTLRVAGDFDRKIFDPASVFADWTDPPKTGLYRVPGGGKIATWEGDA